MFGKYLEPLSKSASFTLLISVVLDRLSLIIRRL